jgi:hypothetical protein
MTGRLIPESKNKDVENKSQGFFLPMLGEYLSDFINLEKVFVWAEEFPELDEHIFVLFRKHESEVYKENIERLKSYKNFAFSYTPDKFYEMLVFNPPSKLVNDYRLLKKGKYSEISDNYKRHILKFHNIRNSNDIGKSIIGVLYKSEEYRISYSEKLGTEIPQGQELASILDPQKETYLDEMKVRTNINNLDLM